MNIDIWNPALALFVVVGTVVIYLTRNRMRRSNEEQQEEVEANNDEVEGDNDNDDAESDVSYEDLDEDDRDFQEEPLDEITLHRRIAEHLYNSLLTLKYTIPYVIHKLHTYIKPQQEAYCSNGVLICTVC